MAVFDPKATDYNPQNALWLGEAAAVAYEDATAVQGAFAGWEVRLLSDPKTDTEGFVAGNGHMVVITFRGTEPKDISDWLTDAEVVLVNGPGGKVHSGFYTRVLAIWPKLLNALEGLQKSGQTLWITGHSLGAGLATVAAAMLLKEKVVGSISGLYTFGQPRTGDPAFAIWFDGLMRERTFRFVNNNDIVTHVPLPPLYRHVGTFLYFDEEGNLQTDEGFWTMLKDAFEGEAKRLLNGDLAPDAIEDHFMKSYLACLGKNADK